MPKQDERYLRHLALISQRQDLGKVGDAGGGHGEGCMIYPEGIYTVLAIVQLMPFGIPASPTARNFIKQLINYHNPMAM